MDVLFKFFTCLFVFISANSSKLTSNERLAFETDLRMLYTLNFWVLEALKLNIITFVRIKREFALEGGEVDVVQMN